MEFAFVFFYSIFSWSIDFRMAIAQFEVADYSVCPPGTNAFVFNYENQSCHYVSYEKIPSTAFEDDLFPNCNQTVLTSAIIRSEDEEKFVISIAREFNTSRICFVIKNGTWEDGSRIKYPPESKFQPSEQHGRTESVKREYLITERDNDDSIFIDINESGHYWTKGECQVGLPPFIQSLVVNPKCKEEITEISECHLVDSFSGHSRTVRFDAAVNKIRNDYCDGSECRNELEVPCEPSQPTPDGNDHTGGYIKVGPAQKFTCSRPIQIDRSKLRPIDQLTRLAIVAAVLYGFGFVFGVGVILHGIFAARSKKNLRSRQST